MVNKRYYKKKGPSFKERVRCPLCGTLKEIAFFSLKHLFGVYRYRYAGKGDITVTMVSKDATFMSYLRESFRDRFLALLEGFTGCRYYSQFQMDDVVEKYEKLLAEQTMRAVPQIIPSILVRTTIEEPNIRPNIIPYQVVIE